MLEEVPLFPLRSVLFPGGYLPLRIFEPRYLDMVQRCHARSEPFGVVALTQGNEVRRAGGEGEQFHEVGTLAHIDSLDRVQPGLLYTRVRGGRRFRIQASRQLSHGLWVGQLALLDADQTVALPTDLRAAADGLQALLSAWSQDASEVELPIQPPLAWDDAGWVANRWAELLPLPPDERQRLMMLDNPLLRLELVNDRLESMARGQPRS